jgi:hypothetical protein
VALSEEELDTFRRLETKLNQARRNHHAPGGRVVRGLETLDAYYEGEQRIQQLGLAVPPELELFLVIANWPQVAVDAIEERLDLEGFRLPGADEADDDLWAVWQANGLDEESQLAHVDALALSRSYVCVGAGDTGPDADVARDESVPLVTVESPFEVIHEDNPRTRTPRAAVKVYKDGQDKFGTLYLPNSTVWLEWGNTGSRRGWVEVDRDEHGMGAVPVVPLVNRPRTARRGGASEMSPVIPLADAAARALTNAQLATEALAVPQRWVLGATKGDFVDAETGNQLPAWETYFGAIWALMNKDAKVGQFAAADLSNFTTIVEHYATIASGLTGLPMRYFGSNSANPPSADGIRADEARLIKRAERRQRAWGGSWERVMRIVKRIQDEDWNPGLAQMETMWRDASTPTEAQNADAVTKKFQAGLLPVEGAWEDMRYSATRRKKLREQFAAQAQDPVLERVARELAGNPAPAVTPPVPGAA